MPDDAELAIRLVLAMLVGGAVGLEREANGQIAGLRTHMSVALGAALFAIVSAYSFAEFIEPRADTNYQVDVTRVASNVVTGVGFLGGGAIIKLGASIRGLTTAASMWVTAAIGLAIGLGSYIAGFASAAALVFALTVLRGRRRWVRRFSRKRETVTLEVEVGDDVSVVLALLNELDPRTLSAQRVSNGWTVRADVHRSDAEVVLGRLADRPDVTGVAAIS
ncbi:MAG TPA: MgtC/SapB family protein [Acidimicrobiia bacterium]|nr:MgtC/SapB family protein [Acidimicrobiia bacterium]